MPAARLMAAKLGRLFTLKVIFSYKCFILIRISSELHYMKLGYFISGLIPLAENMPENGGKAIKPELLLNFWPCSNLIVFCCCCMNDWQVNSDHQVY